jgi:DNA-binding transcriptional LysR family regulator
MPERYQLSMELQELRCFLAVAEELNFNRAAERLHMTQPPLTRAIAKLEHRLGARLFARTTRRVSLTEAGSKLMKVAVPLLQHADEAARFVRHAVADRTRKLTVGSTVIGLFTVVPKILASFRKANPGIEVDVSELPTDSLIESLVRAEIDVGFILTPAAHPQLEMRPIFRDRMRLAVPADHPLVKRGRPASLQGFANETFILHARNENPSMYDELVRCCARAGFKPRVKEMTASQNCMGWVASGAGVHFVLAARDHPPARGVVVVDIEGSPPVFEVAVAWRKGDPTRLLDAFKRMKPEFHESRVAHRPNGAFPKG